MNALSKYISRAALAAALASPCFANDGSLWTRPGTDERGMFADNTAYRIGDIVTILVSESSKLVSSVKMSTSHESNISNDFSQLLFSNVLSHNGETPSTTLKVGANTHEGSGSLDNSQSIEAQISVQVVDVLPNGNLVLEGVRVLTYSGETYYMLTQGICRPDDITTANTVTSSQLADARIEVVAEGALTEAERQGWMTRFINKVSP
jgi:flagellar L-ring protein precursor FlgH